MVWTDRVRQVKILLVLTAVVIAVASLVISHLMVRDLMKEERNNVGVWAEALRSFNNADENTDLALVLRVIEGNENIPTVVLDNEGQVQTYRNLRVKGKTASDSLRYITRRAQAMKARGNVIRIYLDTSSPQGRQDYMEVCFDESRMLQRLTYYPYVQLGVVLIFVVVAIFALLSSKRAEQNKVWVGLSKETAHQLGTPISSLMAWVEVLRETYPQDELIPEMDKDVRRLQRIAERFSKIGSLPEPKPENLNDVVENVVQYIGRRTSNKVRLHVSMPDHPLIVKMSASLFEWVVENLCKNAIDAMDGHGTITLSARDEADCFSVEVSDTGKGIASKNFSNVFMPGFTTKSRGWGLGLSLAKRIVEEYHHGRIFVKHSEIGKGTTFRIELKKY
ncbi:MAG: HAMP domain-containing histidine kinase [Bacteroidaceae bacterium]|nr:HAMP domain-containing histidine kinase [Bacteroidaceae bacterium]